MPQPNQSTTATSAPPRATQLEVWAGVECTVNRVGGQYFDQLAASSHDVRSSDLDLFAALGIKAIRYPVLWERIAPHGLASADWSWADERLGRLRELGLRPIVGLVHHGSGPHWTSLVDPAFVDGLAEFAAAVAERYPWVEDYTPVNEPLTTARFSGLYGHWYPHGADAETFCRALVIQCRAVQAAMRAIRERVPGARLVQTEDLGKTYSTPALRYQADFENERRWLSLDLLCGRVDRPHPMWSYLTWAGLSPAEWEMLQAEPCPPDVVGLNYYLTSERFLDDHLDAYPAHTHGGNGRDAYADVEAVRVCAQGLTGPAMLLREAWERFGLPLAVTEAHAGASREDQVRWLLEVWHSANHVRSEGIDLRAVTAWALLGAHNWHTLVTRDEGYYEPGVFDLRAPQPRPTLLAQALRALAEQGDFEHPILAAPGWWHRAERVLYPTRPCGRRTGQPKGSPQGLKLQVNGHSNGNGHTPPGHTQPSANGAGRNGKVRQPQPIVVLGATGTLGQAFGRLCTARGLSFRLLTRQQMNITGAESVAAALDELRPWAVINTAGYVRVDQAELEPELCRRVNTLGPIHLAEACAQRGLPLLTYSSDLVFDGRQTTPYLESSPVAPLNVYGASKAEAEREVLQRWPSALVVRTSAFFGPWDEHNFVHHALRHLAAGLPFRAAYDQVVSPTYVPDLVNVSLDLLLDGESGVWHLANQGAVSWAEFARRAAEAANLTTGSLEAVPASVLGLTAARPAYSALGSERAWLLPPLEEALARYCCEGVLPVPPVGHPVDAERA